MSSEVGLAGDLFESCLELFTTLFKTLHRSNILSKLQSSCLHKQLERFLLWGDGFSPAKGELDSILSTPDGSSLNPLILHLLQAIGKELFRKLSPTLPNALRYPSLQKTRLVVASLLEKVNEVVPEEDGLYDSTNESDDSEAEDIDGGLDNIISNITTYVDCLMDTTASLEQAAETAKNRMVTANVEKVHLPIFAASEMAQSYCRNILDKFPDAPQPLIQRLGEANCERHKRIRDRLENADSCSLEEASTQIEVQIEDCKQTVAGGETLFHDSGLGTSIAAPSTLLVAPQNPDFLATKVPKAASIATFTSFLTDDTNHDGRMPPMPHEARAGKPFWCSICGQVVRNVFNRVDWKKHVFSDLQPYICTFEACPFGLSTYASRRSWWAHESKFHRYQLEAKWTCVLCKAFFTEQGTFEDHLESNHKILPDTNSFEASLAGARRKDPQVSVDKSCPLCYNMAGEMPISFAKHVGKHMEGIALAVLPQGSNSELTRQISPVQDRGAQIRKNDAERAASQSEEQSRQAGKTDDGEISDEETIESRVTRMKARVAKLTEYDSSGFLLRHQREVHKLHSNPKPKWMCPHQGCARSSTGPGFTQKQNPQEHLRRIHGDIGGITEPLDVTLADHFIIPSIEIFKTDIRNANPRMPDYLCDRLGSENIYRYKMLLALKVKHAKAVQLGNCSSSRLCSLKANVTPNPVTGSGKSYNESGLATPTQFDWGIPMPPTKNFPAEIECPFCFRVKRLKNLSDWTKHVYEDLQPYTCTFSECSESKSFRQKADWVRHENERHRQLEWWQCPEEGCHHKSFRRDNFIRHLVREHEMLEPEPTPGATKSGYYQFDSKRNRTAAMLLACHCETENKPYDRSCKFCGDVYMSWKKLSDHLALHLKKTSLPILELVQKADVAAETILSPIIRPIHHLTSPVNGPILPHDDVHTRQPIALGPEFSSGPATSAVWARRRKLYPSLSPEQSRPKESNSND